MLQTRFENEQFNSLTKLRSRNDFITTDRPDSSQLVDLHIYLIPKSIWRNVQHLAQNEAMDDAISAGFVRVSPDMKLRILRKSIEISCGTESFFPRDFIFLRSVGRCLTRVKQTQENELKVKNYRPPQTLASEIYLLEGRHEDYGTTPSASPALSSAGYLFGSRHRRLNCVDYNQLPSRLSQHYQFKPSRPENTNLPHINTNPFISRLPSARIKSGSKFIQVGSNESSPNISVITSITARELAKLKEEQERLRQRQAELERMRRAAEAKKVHSDREENERQRRREEKAQADRDEEERQRRRRQEKAQADRDEEERRRRQRRQEKADAERRRLEQQELAATKIQASFRGFKDRQIFRARQRHFPKKNSRKSSHTTINNEKKLDMNDDELSDGSHISSRSSIGSTSDIDSNSSRPETRTIRKENRESLHSNSSSLFSIKIERKISSDKSSLHSELEDLPIKTNLVDDENIRTATVTKIRHSDEEILPLSTPDINDDETYELNRREVDTKRRRQTEEEKRKTKELEDQRRELAKPQQREDPETLRTRLQELRKRRADLEKLRDEVIKRLKHVHQKITSRRKDARGMWKKKYFQEKKKTPAIEDRADQLKTDLDLIHSKTIQIIDNECKHFTQMGFLKEAEAGNLVLKMTRTQYESDDIRHQIDQAKLRLTTDVKLRNQTENECQTLKHELSQAKMNLNHMKNRVEV